MINKTENLKKFNKHAHGGLSYVDQSLGGVPVAISHKLEGKRRSTAFCRRCGIVLRPSPEAAERGITPTLPPLGRNAFNVQQLKRWKENQSRQRLVFR